MTSTPTIHGSSQSKTQETSSSTATKSSINESSQASLAGLPNETSSTSANTQIHASTQVNRLVKPTISQKQEISNQDPDLSNRCLESSDIEQRPNNSTRGDSSAPVTKAQNRNRKKEFCSPEYLALSTGHAAVSIAQLPIDSQQFETLSTTELALVIDFNINYIRQQKVLLQLLKERQGLVPSSQEQSKVA